ncbi:hypothetical protein scyTo_0006104, partial [Scyliorhinus torazame]|nr:hypothetical protein [Scyliorhinus torazame]
GNVCFMEQLSDDPEGAFVPPEFDITGNTFEAHVYSLGATLAAAAEYVIEPELEPNLSQELRSLLDQMQREKPEERPDIEGILNTCEEKLKCSSSDIICRNLSAIGRRVLSIESVGTLQDGCEETCKEKKRQEGVGHELQTSERNPADGSSSTEDLPYDLNVLNNGTTEVICKAVKCARDVDPDSTFEADKIFQPSSDSMASVEICERREAVLAVGPEETTADVKIKGHEADRIPPAPQKRSTARKRMLPKLPTEMVGSAQHLNRSKMELGRSATSNLSPVSFSDIAAGSLSSLDSVNLLNVTDCPQKVQFRTKNNDFTFIPKCSLPSEISNVNNSSEWAQKVSNMEVVNKNLPNSCNLIFDKNRERSLKSPFTLGKMSSTKSLKAKIAAAKFTSAGMNSQIDLRSSSGILLETEAVVGGYSINIPGTEGNDYLSCMDSNLSEAERTIGSHQWNYFKQSRCQSVNDLSKSNSMLFSNVTQLYQDDNCEQLPPTRATENKPAEFSFDSQYISLEELLSEDDRPLKDHELWALCYECLISLQLCKDYPEYLCLESAYIDTSGEVLFLSPTSNGDLDSFYLAPEFEKQGEVTEKACVYGIAAILWAAAKFNAPVNQKLPLSRNLKNLLLDMAKRNATERPSITDAMEICNNYLIKRGICSREILILLRNSMIQNYQKQGMDVIRLNCKTELPEFSHSPLGNTDFAQESPGTGFVPLASDSKLTAVKGPIPCQYSVNSKSPSKLPEAFTSPATHFKPIILTQHKEKTSSVKVSSKTPTTKQLVKAMKDKNQGAAPIEDIKSNADVKALLQKAVHLIKEEFAFDGYLENGEEAHAMGEYILSLKSLKFSTFNSAISEKFYDLYWDDKLLEQLYEIVNGNPPPPAPLPEATTRPNPGYFNPTLQSTIKKKKTVPGHGKQRSSDDNWEKAVDLEAREISRKPHLSPAALSERVVLDVNCLSDNLYSAKCKEDQLLSNVKMILGQDTRNMVPDDTDLKQPKSDNCEEEEKMAKHFYQMEDSCNFTGEDCNPSQDLKFNPSNEEKKEGTGQTTEGSESLVSESLRHMESNIGKKRCNPGWSSAFFGIEYFNQQVKTCVKQLGQHNFNEGDKIETKLLELEQQLNMETKDFRKTKVFYQKLQLQEKRNKGVDVKVVLPKLKQQLEEMRLKVEFLELAKRYLEILQMEQWGLRPSVLHSLVSLSFQSETLDLTSTDSNSHLTFHALKGDQSQSKKGTQVLQAGTAVGLMAYLYSSVNQKCSADCTKVYNRSLDLLQAWIEECYNVDFAQDTEVLHKLKTFISLKAMQLDSRGQYLINLLHNFSEKKKTCNPPDFSFSLEDMKNEEDNQSIHSLSRKILDGDISRKSFKWKISKRTEPSSPHQKEKYYNTATALPKPCSNSFPTELSGAYQKVDEKGLFMLADYSPQHIAQQLTLLQQELFQDCHPVHFLNSRAFGVKDKPITVRKSSVSSETAFVEGSSLFVPEYKQHQYLLDLIRYADNVCHWVSAEIVTCDTPKAQHAQLSKFLSIAKICYELRNFATAMQILSSLESLIVRQLPSWKSLSSKALEITEELSAVQVFLKSDSLCLMEGDSFSKQPTMPCARILAMHVQQLEIGAFTMANGTYKWPKLRKIAMVVSQIRAFQEKPYMFIPDLDLQAHLRQQITHFSEVDIHVLAAENKTNFYQSSTEWHSRKIQDTLRKVKATFQ